MHVSASSRSNVLVSVMIILVHAVMSLRSEDPLRIALGVLVISGELQYRVKLSAP